jgi:hypothetical protein
MSFLVAMARAHYHDNAFDAFTASSGYSLENARAMGNACAVAAGGRATNIVSLPAPIRSW